MTRIGVGGGEQPLPSACVLRDARIPRRIATPRKPNYDFERRERERNKAAEAAKKAQAKADKKAAEQATPEAGASET